MAYFFPYTKGFLLYELNRFEKNESNCFESESNRIEWTLNCPSPNPEPMGQFQLGIKHRWVQGILDYSNEWPLPFPRWDDYEIVKIHIWQNLKIIFSGTNGPNSFKLSTKHPWVMGIQVCSNEGPRTIQGEVIRN